MSVHVAARAGLLVLFLVALLLTILGNTLTFATMDRVDDFTDPDASELYAFKNSYRYTLWVERLLDGATTVSDSGEIQTTGDLLTRNYKGGNGSKIAAARALLLLSVIAIVGAMVAAALLLAAQVSVSAGGWFLVRQERGIAIAACVCAGVALLFELVSLLCGATYFKEEKSADDARFIAEVNAVSHVPASLAAVSAENALRYGPGLFVFIPALLLTCVGFVCLFLRPLVGITYCDCQRGKASARGSGSNEDESSSEDEDNNESPWRTSSSEDDASSSDSSSMDGRVGAADKDGRGGSKRKVRTGNVLERGARMPSQGSDSSSSRSDRPPRAYRNPRNAGYNKSAAAPQARRTMDFPEDRTCPASAPAGAAARGGMAVKKAPDAVGMVERSLTAPFYAIPIMHSSSSSSNSTDDTSSPSSSTGSTTSSAPMPSSRSLSHYDNGLLMHGDLVMSASSSSSSGSDSPAPSPRGRTARRR